VALHQEEGFQAPSWAPWAAQHGAFCESPGPQDLGFLIPSSGGAYPLAALESLRRLAPQAAMAAAQGSLSLAAERVFDSVRWSLAGPAKEEALGLLLLAKPGSFLITETDYGLLRSQVKIQLIAEMQLIPGHSLKKVFNIIGVS
jgi:hypothetical protein